MKKFFNGLMRKKLDIATQANISLGIGLVSLAISIAALIVKIFEVK